MVRRLPVKAGWPGLALGLCLVGLVGLTSHDTAPSLVTAQGGRPHCGLVTHNETWNEGDSPHLVTCDVVVRSSRLTIGAGSTVLMSEGANLVIQNGSELVAIGIPEAQIRFQANTRDEVPGSWGQLRVEAGARTSTLDYVTFIGGGAGNRPMVEVHNEALILNHSRFQKALASPLAFAADAVGPSLGVAGPGPARQACNLVQFIDNGESAIRVLAHRALDVTQTQTWYNFCLPYRVDGEITVAGAESPSLSLEQGVVIQFETGAGLTAGYSITATGQLETNGSADLPVVLTGAQATPGSWRGATIGRFASGSSSLFGLRLEYGGTASVPGSLAGKAMLTVERPDALAGGGLVFAHAAGYPLAAHAGAVGGLASGLVGAPGGNFVNNGIQRVLVLADLDTPDINRTAEWPGLGMPYEIRGDLLIARPQPPAVLTLGEGAELIFDGTETLTAGMNDPSLGQGGFKAMGSADAPVVVRGERDEPGSWGGLHLRWATTAELQDVRLSSGGAGDRAMLEWGSPKGGRVVSTTFEKAKGYPVRVHLEGAEVFIGEAQLDDAKQNSYLENGVNRILLWGLVLGDRPQRWADPGIPAEVEGTLRIQPVKATTATLTLLGGLNLQFQPDAALSVGDAIAEGHGVLVVPGEDEALTVNIGPVDSELGWRGLTIEYTGFVRARRLSVRNAGRGDALRLYGSAEFDGDVAFSAGMSETASAIGLYGAGRPRLTGHGLHIGPARTGIYVFNSDGTVDISRTVFADIAEWAILNDSPRNCVSATLVYWGDPSGPQTGPDPDPCAGGHANPAGRGGRVSPGVNWWPFALDASTFAPSSSATPSPTPTPRPGESLGPVYLPLASR